jgi:hypothetical protein
MQDTTFVESMSRIVNRGCHYEIVCGAPVSNIERLTNFEKIISYLGLQKASQEDEEIVSTVYDTPRPSMKPTITPSLPDSIATASPTLSPETTQPSLREVSIEPSSGSRGVTFSPISPSEEYILQTIVETALENSKQLLCIKSCGSCSRMCNIITNVQL